MKPSRFAAGALLAVSLAAGAETHVVDIVDMKFEPQVVRVKPGDTVTWRNKDLTPHTATSAGVFDSAEIAGGKGWSWKAGAKGRHAYVCTYHLGMKGTVVVE